MDVDDAGVQQFTPIVGADSQQIALVVRQAVGHEEDVGLLCGLPTALGQLSLLVLERSQDVGRAVQTQGAAWLALLAQQGTGR